MYVFQLIYNYSRNDVVGLLYLTFIQLLQKGVKRCRVSVGPRHVVQSCIGVSRAYVVA